MIIFLPQQQSEKMQNVREFCMGQPCWMTWLKTKNWQVDYMTELYSFLECREVTSHENTELQAAQA